MPVGINSKGELVGGPGFERARASLEQGLDPVPSVPPLGRAALPYQIMTKEKVQKEDEQTKLWELYKLFAARPRAIFSDDDAGHASRAMNCAVAFLARWKAETEAPASDPGQFQSAEGDMAAYLTEEAKARMQELARKINTMP
jgi:hypothetical protein